MPTFSRNRPLIRASLLLAAALAAAAAAKWLFDSGQLLASLASVVLALVLCFGVIYLCAPMVARWGRLRSVRLPWSYGLTKEGFFFVTTVLVVAFAALTSGNNLIYLVLSCMLATMVLSGLVSRLGLAGLQLELSFPTHLFARQRSLARVKLKNLKRGLPSFSIWVGLAPTANDHRDVVMDEVYCPMISGGGAAVVSVPITFGRRGRFGRGHFRLRSRFPFSFVERRVRLPLTQEVLVYPSVESSRATASIIEQFEPIQVAFCYRFGALSAAGDESRYVGPAGWFRRIAVAQVQAPADPVGAVRERAVDRLAVKQNDTAFPNRASDSLSVGQIFVADPAFLFRKHLVRPQSRFVTAGDHL